MNQPPSQPSGPPSSWGQPPPAGNPPGNPPGYGGYGQPPPTSSLAIVALVTTFLCMPIGLVLAIIALARIGKAQGALGGKTIAIVALALNLLFVPMAGILAAIAIPGFVKFGCRAKQSEAKTNLKSIYVAEQAFHAELNKFTPSLQEAGWAPMGTTLRYTYELVSVSDDAFVAEARGVRDMEGDLWRINQDNVLEHVADRCD